MLFDKRREPDMTGEYWCRSTIHIKQLNKKDEG